MMRPRQLCIFTISGEVFGLEVSKVQEVLRHLEMTRVPLAPRHIRGLINLRGQIVMAIDLQSCLDLPASPSTRPRMNLVIRTADGPISLLVDDIRDVVDVDESSFDPPPPNRHGVARKAIRGTFTLAGRLVSLLDVDSVLSMIEVEPSTPGVESTASRA